MSGLFKPTLRAALVLSLGIAVSGCTPWIETKASSAERALNCAVLSANVPGAKTTQASACALHPAA